jgi:hypothetical protein
MRSKYLSKSKILVRVLTTCDEYMNKIAGYTNSQNSIFNVDLKALSNEQIELEQYLDEHNIIYARKLIQSKFKVFLDKKLNIAK